MSVLRPVVDDDTDLEKICSSLGAPQLPTKELRALTDALNMRVPQEQIEKEQLLSSAHTMHCSMPQSAPAGPPLVDLFVLVTELRARWRAIRAWHAKIVDALRVHYVECVARAVSLDYERRLEPFCKTVTHVRQYLRRAAREGRHTVAMEWQGMLQDIDLQEVAMWHHTVFAQLAANTKDPDANNCVTCTHLRTAFLLFKGIGDEDGNDIDDDDSSMAISIVQPGLTCFRYVLEGLFVRLFSSCLSMIDVPAVVCDPSTLRCPVIALNDAFTKLTLYSALDIVGYNLSILHRLHDAINSSDDDVAATTKTFSSADCVRKDNTPLNVHFTVIKLRIRGCLFLFLTHANPLTTAENAIKVEMQCIGFGKQFLHSLFHATWDAFRASDDNDPQKADVQEEAVNMERSAFERIIARVNLHGREREISAYRYIPDSSLASPSPNKNAPPCSVLRRNSRRSSDAQNRMKEGVQNSVREGQKLTMYTKSHGIGDEKPDYRSGHPTGCTPCSYFCHSLNGCDAGVNCNYCHIASDHVSRRLLKKIDRQARASLLAGGHRSGTFG
eukprot:GEMP01005959.1.p1 GENE.GEMP01005959.1~~GEMP01005959.1.p1  ORF type:complete len:556 (+),score=144.79 GEMP01005959.1:487-2154(+)